MPSNLVRLAGQAEAVIRRLDDSLSAPRPVFITEPEHAALTRVLLATVELVASIERERARRS